MDTPLWTLSVEAFFYLTLPIWMIGLQRLSRRDRYVAAAILAGGFTAAWLLTLHTASTPFVYWLFYESPWLHLPEFLLGALVALEVREGLRVPLWVAAFGCAVGGWVLWHSPVARSGPLWNPMPHGPVLIPFVLVVAAFASTDLRGWRTAVNSRAMVGLGNWSYSMYLFHFLVYYLLLQTAPHWPLWMKRNPWEVAAFVVVPPIVVAGLVHHLIERPAERLLRPRAQKTPLRRAPAAALALSNAVAEPALDSVSGQGGS